MGTECSSEQLVFEGFEGRQVVGSFDGGAVTSNGGAALLREADRAIGLTAKVARCFRDERDADLIVHRLDTMLAQRVHAIALGYEDLNDHDELRFDPVLGLLSDTLESKRDDVATLAGKSTLNRMENGLTGGSTRYHKISVNDAELERVFLDIFVAAHERAPERIILDLDATDDPLHGDQEGRFYHGYYRCYCALPHRECYRRSPAVTGAALANRIAGVHGGEHQHGRAARGGVGGGGALPIGGAA